MSRMGRKIGKETTSERQQQQRGHSHREARGGQENAA